MKNLAHLLFALLLIISACKTANEKDYQALIQIEESYSPTDKSSITKLDSAYAAYMDKYPDDTVIARIMYADAMLHLKVLENPDKAAILLGQFANKYPSNEKAPEALFQQAFIYDEMLKNYDLAAQSYDAVISKYPSSEFASQAKVLKEILGKDLNELPFIKNADSANTNKEQPL